MAITDELRDYARHLHNVWYDPRGNVYTYTTMDNAPSLDAVRLDEHVLAIADRIDAECERQLEALYHDMSDDEYIELPKDADGELVDIGDLVDEMLPFGGYAKPAHVDTMELYRSANGYGWMVKLDAENRALISPKLLRHHKQQTVEDVLTDLCEHVWESALLGSTWSDSPVESYITEYAAKMRLAESEES